MRKRFESFAGNIIELNRLLQKTKEMEMSKFGLKANHTMCLYYLGTHEEGLSATQLIELSREDKGAMSRCLKELVEKNLVVCRLNGDKRSYRSPYFLTDAGREVYKQMDERIENALFNGGNGLTDKNRKIFYDAMDQIVGNLTAYLEKN